MTPNASPTVILRAKHPLWIRWAHWLNFPILTLMVISGLQIKWANSDEYLAWIPESWWGALGLDHKLAIGMAVHFALMWVFVVNGLLYSVYLLVSGEWRGLFPQRESLQGAWQVLLHDMGLRRAPLPPGKFNHAQRIAYTGVLALGVIATGSGLVIYKPIQMDFFREIWGGYQTARVIHLLVAFAIILFFFVHIAQVVRAGWNNFQSMVTGEEVERESAD